MDTTHDVERSPLRDDFSDGLSAGTQRARWRLRPVPGFPGGDGIVETGPDGLVVVPTEVDPTSGDPAFAAPPRPLSEADHLRWAIMANHETPDGLPGFALGSGGRMSVAAELSVRAYGLERHTYGDAVEDPHRDLRLGSGALICMDRESGIVFDFIVADRCVFAVYERLAFPGTEHAGFTYAVPVLDREPGDRHRLMVSYDVAAASARWYIGGVEVLEVNRVGCRVLPSRYALRDNGRPEAQVAPRQLTCGLALFADRLWGQGVRLAVRSVEVTLGR